MAVIISAISWRPVLVVGETGIPGETTDNGQATGKLYHFRLRVLFFVIYKAGCRMECNIGQDAIFLIHSEMFYFLCIFIKEN
jgi:hypothetical protein